VQPTAAQATTPERRWPDPEIRDTLRQLRSGVHGRFFTRKLAACVVLTGGGVWLALQPALWLRVGGIVLLGCMFAHAAELQHEALHNLAYRGKRANKVVGIALGVPMLVSFTAYRVAHLRHHRDLGTPKNREFFDYGNQYGGDGRQPPPRVALTWLVRFSMVHHYGQFAANVARSLVGKDIPGENPHNSRAIRHEYLITVGFLLSLVLISVATVQPVIVWLWLLPMLLVAAPLHALIELPEHYRCETLDRSPFVNSRTIRSNRIATWFTNGNNFHVEHHLAPNLPIDQLPSLHLAVRDRLRYFHTGYLSYFGALLKGAPTSGVAGSDR
jgi:fatty acid desaturase